MKLRKRAALAAMGYFFLYMAMQFISIVAVGCVAFYRAYSQNPAIDGMQYLSDFMEKYAVELLFVSILATLLVIYAIGIFSKKGIKHLVGWGNKLTFKLGAICCVTGIAANAWVGVIISSLPFSAEQVNQYAQASASLDSGGSWVAFFTVVLFAPLLEELIFRGLMMKNLAIATNTGVAIALQAIVFGSMHVGIVWMTYAVFLGGVLGYIRACTGSLKAAILFHIAFNGANFLVAIVTALAGDFTVPMFLVSTGLMVWGVYQISKAKPKPTIEIEI